MSEYTPDKWTIVGDGEVFKIFGSWAGGYLDSDNWRLSSGLKSIEENATDINGELLMHNHSGSIYKGHRNNEGVISFYNQGVLDNMIEKYNKIKDDDKPEMRVYKLAEYLELKVVDEWQGGR